MVSGQERSSGAADRSGVFHARDERLDPHIEHLPNLLAEGQLTRLL